MNFVKSFDLFGADATQIPCIPGKGSPTTATEGAVGCLYMDTSTGALWSCTAVANGKYTWEPNNTGGTAANAVLYTTQALVEAQKNQARENIGAASQERVATLEQQIADLLYKPITITAFTAKDTATGKSTLEIGSKVTNVTFAWAFSKAPKTVAFNGESMTADSLGTTMDVNVTSNTSWPLVATDERNTEAKASAGLTFLRGVYYGVLEHGADIDSAAILALDKKLQSGRAVDFTATPGVGMRPAYALPSSGYGTPTFKIGGFEYAWERVATFAFTNASDHTENYDVWMHSQDVTGSVTINVT